MRLCLLFILAFAYGWFGCVSFFHFRFLVPLAVCLGSVLCIASVFSTPVVFNRTWNGWTRDDRCKVLGIGSSSMQRYTMVRILKAKSNFSDLLVFSTLTTWQTFEMQRGCFYINVRTALMCLAKLLRIGLFMGQAEACPIQVHLVIRIKNRSGSIRWA